MNDIQSIIDNTKAHFIELPMGEYEGNFIIKRPCCISGNSTVLWAEKEPVLKICSKNVSLKNLRIETLQKNSEKIDTIISEYDDIKFENVEVKGNIKGISQYCGYWNIPQILKLDEFYSNKECTFIFDVVIPTNSRIVSLIKGIEVEPQNLSKGKNTIFIRTSKIKDNVYVYGELLFVGDIIKRIYVSGVAKRSPQKYTENKNIWTPSKENNVSKSENQYISFPKINCDLSAYILQKGQRLLCKELEKETIEVEFELEGMIKGMEIDPYVFLLDKNNMALRDENLIFFGNKKSLDNSVKIISKNIVSTVEVDLKKISSNVERVSISYSIYGDNPDFNFSKLKGIVIKIKENKKEKMIFKPDKFSVETTITAIDFYRYKGEWKINVISSGYKDGIKKLCENYGLEVIED